MAKKTTKNTSKKSVDAIKHTDAKRKNIPTAELGPVMAEAAKGSDLVGHA